jgi:enamine deaminase RidA (YjgF/YER057c/UK114 family)
VLYYTLWLSRKADTAARTAKTQCLKNLSAVLEEAGSSLQNCVKVNVFLTDMTNFAAANKVYEGFFGEPKPVGGDFLAPWRSLLSMHIS